MQQLKSFRAIKQALFSLLLFGTICLALSAQAAQAGRSAMRRPSITSFRPTSGAPGTTVTVSGTNLRGASAVAFNGTNASYTVNSSRQITATVPAGATSGPITATTTAGTASSASVFQTAGDTSQPTVTLTAPMNGGIVSGNVGVSATATDNVGVSKVEFYRNGSLFAMVTAAPHTYSWDSTDTANGSSTLTALAYDTAGNFGSSNPLTVTVNNVGLSAGIFVAPAGSDTTGDGTISNPFATLAKAQATMRLGGPQITYIRGGYYALPAVTQNGVSYGLHLTAADNGQTWSYYPPDGYDSAILDGGSTSSSTGIQELITIDGASHVTINGLQLQHFRWIGIGLHGGSNTYFSALFPVLTVTAGSNTITNNIIHDGGYDTSPIFATGGGAVYGEGDIPSTTVTNNAIYNISAFGIAAFSGFTPPSGNVGSLRIANNVVISVCLLLTDCGSLYVHDENTTARNISITNNYLRDSGTSRAAGRSIYLDDGVSSATVADNISTGIFKWAFTIHGGSNNTISSNIADMTDGNEILLYQARAGMTGMTGNVVRANLIISGGGGGWYEGGATIGAQPTIRDNVYHQYAGLPPNAGGFSGLSGDASPIFADPQLSCWTYALASGSSVYSAPALFVSLLRSWGPPGYRIPTTGTPPSQPHSCY